MSQLLDPGLLEEEYGVHNYHPLPVVITRGEGSWVEDVDGRRYFDALSAYSALNFGHRHPRLVAAAHEQLDRLTLTSRAFRNDRLGDLCKRLAELCAMERVLPMNTGAEAVETAIKAARKWGYEVKGVAGGPGEDRRLPRQLPRPDDDDRLVLRRPDGAHGLRPVHARLRGVPFGDLEALEAALDDRDGRVPGRADPGRGRRHHPARRLPDGRAGAVHARERAADRR